MSEFIPKYYTKRCVDLSEQECYRFSLLFSMNYGRWSGKDNPIKKGKRIKLPVSYYQRLTQMEDMFVSYCEDDGILIGSCFFLKKVLENQKICVWITQLVVDNSYRKRGIATRLLQSAWGFSDYFAWGLATANSLTVKTLESVTWRKVTPMAISENIDTIRSLCESLPYRTGELTIGDDTSVIDTSFFIDREIHESVDKIYIERLGVIPDGYEWLAFTFKSQPMVLDERHLNDLLEFSSEQLNDAYSRMEFDNQPWTKGTSRELDYLISAAGIPSGSTILDVGCGQGRHSIEAAKRGFHVTGIDASESNIVKAQRKSAGLEVSFLVWDARKRLPGKAFDCVFCLYDVIGSYRNLEDNVRIIRNIALKLRKGGIAMISVMNMSHIALRANHRGSVKSNPELLLQLPASRTMQNTGDMFNADYQLLDEAEHLVYHKEQFETDGQLSAEYVVADYRFTLPEISALFESNGFDIIESRYVCAGHFDVALTMDDDKAKEILLIVRKK